MCKQVIKNVQDYSFRSVRPWEKRRTRFILFACVCMHMNGTSFPLGLLTLCMRSKKTGFIFTDFYFLTIDDLHKKKNTSETCLPS